jgi:hypothetical protein
MQYKPKGEGTQIEIKKQQPNAYKSTSVVALLFSLTLQKLVATIVLPTVLYTVRTSLPS